MIYDCFTFFNENELTELRMKTLWDYVDYFVVCEAKQTHTGIPREPIFRQFNKKVIYVLVEKFPEELDDWGRENYQRNALAKGYEHAGPNDLILISDVDEIPNPSKLKRWSGTNKPIFAFEQKLYFYYVNNVSESLLWKGTVAALKRAFPEPQYLRDNRWNAFPIVTGGGWHYTSIGGKERIREKFAAFAEQDYNIDKYMGDENLDECLRTGRDLTSRGVVNRFIDISEHDHKELKKWIIKYPQFYYESTDNRK